MKNVLDTHILLWWFMDDPKLPPKYKELLENAEEEGSPTAISVITLWEIAQLVDKGRLRFTLSLDKWFQTLEEDPWLEIIGLNGNIVLDSTRIGTSFHKDPTDRMIVATTRYVGGQLLTVDERIITSKTVAIA